MCNLKCLFGQIPRQLNLKVKDLLGMFCEARLSVESFCFARLLSDLLCLSLSFKSQFALLYDICARSLLK